MSVAPTPTSALDRVLRPWEPDLDPAAARQFLRFSFTQEDKARSLDLSSKANAGEADEPELAELTDVVATNDALMLLQSKARLSLRASGLLPAKCSRPLRRHF